MTFKERLRQKILPFLVGHTVKMLLTVIGWTCTFRFTGLDHLIATASSSRCILAFWHNRLGMITEILKRAAPQFRYAAMISNSRDGEIIAVVAESYRHGRAIRVPHDKRAEALQTTIQNLKYGKEIIIITPDGPRGPLEQVKPGAVLAAKAAEATIIPLSWTADRVWRFNTWDKLMLPKPFSKIEINIGEPFKLDGDEAKAHAMQLQDALLSL